MNLCLRVVVSASVFLGLGLSLSTGCGGPSNSVVQETPEMTFDQMAEMAAKETDLSEQTADTAGK